MGPQGDTSDKMQVPSNATPQARCTDNNLALCNAPSEADVIRSSVFLAYFFIPSLLW